MTGTRRRTSSLRKHNHKRRSLRLSLEATTSTSSSQAPRDTSNLTSTNPQCHQTTLPPYHSISPTNLSTNSENVQQRHFPRPHRHPLPPNSRYLSPSSLPHLSPFPSPQHQTRANHPLPVWIKSGLCTADSLINICLCVLGYFPGLLHAWYIIAKYPEASDDAYERINDGGEGGTVSYYYVGPAQQQQQQGQGHGQQGGQQQRGYGATNHNMVPERQQPSGGEGASAGVPPSYEQAVRGDHKVQT